MEINGTCKAGLATLLLGLAGFYHVDLVSICNHHALSLDAIRSASCQQATVESLSHYLMSPSTF